MILSKSIVIRILIYGSTTLKIGLITLWEARNMVISQILEDGLEVYLEVNFTKMKSLLFLL